jgi:hypothetical protein
MTPVTSLSPGLVDEIVLVDLVALGLSIVTVSIVWYGIRRIFPDEVRDVPFFLTFIGVVVPFVMLIYFGLAVINYDAIATGTGWPPILPLSALSPLVVSAVVFYIGQIAWLWWSWRE